MRDITGYIPYGRKNAIRKAALCRLTGLNERSIRDKIKKANEVLTEDGFAIISTSRSVGYWITDDLEELKAYLREAEHRANQIHVHNEPVYRLVASMERKPL